MKKTAKSRARQIMATVVIGFLVLTAYFLVWSYWHSVAQAEQASLVRLAGIANSLALQIDGDKHQSLLEKYPQRDALTDNAQDNVYAEIHTLLEKNYVANMLHTPVYTIVFDSLSNSCYFGVTSAPMPYFRHAYTSAPEIHISKRKEGAMIPMYEDEFGVWLSAFSVIKNNKGAAVAVVQADEQFDYFLHKTRKELLENLLFSLLIFGVFFFLLIRILQPMLRRERLDKEALEAANAQIRQLDDFRKEMIANVSHDLRTPMSSILGFAEVLQNNAPPLAAADRARYLHIIMSEAKRMDTMIGELFDLSKLEAGQIVLKKERFNFVELAQDILQKYKLLADGKNVQLITNFQEQMPLVEADIRWMDRVMQNLMGNALKHVNTGGFVKMTVFVEANLLHFKVCNSGQTIEKEHLVNIFDRYFKSANHSAESTGLGLAIVKKIVEMHSGRVWAEANENITTFRFTIEM